MKWLRTNAEFLALAAQCAPSAACARAIREGRAWVADAAVSPDGLPGWRIRVVSLREKEWTIEIYCDETERKYIVKNVSDDELKREEADRQYRLRKARNEPNPLHSDS